MMALLQPLLSAFSYNSVFLVNILFIYIICFWPRWVFIAARGLSVVVASGSCSSQWCTGFSLQWLLLLWSTGSRHAGFSSCGAWAQQLWLAGSREQAQQLRHMGLVALRHVGSSRTRDRTRVPSIGRWILNHCITRQVPAFSYDSYFNSRELLNSLYHIQNLRMKKRTDYPNHLFQNQSIHFWKFPFLVLLFDFLFCCLQLHRPLIQSVVINFESHLTKFNLQIEEVNILRPHEFILLFFKHVHKTYYFILFPSYSDISQHFLYSTKTETCLDENGHTHFFFPFDIWLQWRQKLPCRPLLVTHTNLGLNSGQCVLGNGVQQ